MVENRFSCRPMLAERDWLNSCVRSCILGHRWRRCSAEMGDLRQIQNGDARQSTKDNKADSSYLADCIGNVDWKPKMPGVVYWYLSSCWGRVGFKNQGRERKCQKRRGVPGDNVCRVWRSMYDTTNCSPFFIIHITVVVLVDILIVSRKRERKSEVVFRIPENIMVPTLTLVGLHKFL